jgi:galactokinase
MSSSSAMIVAFFLALAEVNEIWDAAEFQGNVTSLVELASYLASNENGQNFGALAGDRGVGTAGGSEDHTAILCCQPGMLSQYAYCPARHVADVPLPPSLTFVIASSGVAAEKTGAAMAAYNRASRLAGIAAQVWRQTTGRDDPHLAAAIVGCSGDVNTVRNVLKSASLDGHDVDRTELLARFDHFCRENERVLPAAVAAIESGDMVGFGHVVEESQVAAEELLGNQIAETKFLAAEARQLGATAASAFGAGFGGSVWALVERSHVADFSRAWEKGYAQTFSQHRQRARFSLSAAGPSAMRVV